VKSGAFVAVRNGFAFPTGNSGFPKSHDVSKGIDKAAGHWRGRAGEVKDATVGQVANGTGYERTDKGEPATPDAAKWQGFGTALKPAWEPICLARKPLIGTVAANVLEHGTGALNVDGCRVGTEGGTAKGRSADKSQTDSVGGYLNAKAGSSIDAGRWPANIVTDGSPEVVSCFPDVKSSKATVTSKPGSVSVNGAGLPSNTGTYGADGSGSAARFFYTAKADKLDRLSSKHPTVKPVDLMQWLCRLVTPPGGTVLDPFAGSGSTGEAAWREGFNAILIEREEEYQADIARRMELADKGPTTRKAASRTQASNDNLPLFGGVEAT
jgi:site-specific DNA-methyltransferase (adenine-specific)